MDNFTEGGKLVQYRECVYEYARLVFDRLQEHGKYRVLMTDELDKKLEEFTPIT